MWNNGKDLLWSHIVRIAQGEAANRLKLIPKLNTKTAYSAINVWLATEVLCNSEVDVLFNHYPSGTQLTAKFRQYMKQYLIA